MEPRLRRGFVFDGFGPQETLLKSHTEAQRLRESEQFSVFSVPLCEPPAEPGGPRGPESRAGRTSKNSKNTDGASSTALLASKDRSPGEHLRRGFMILHPYRPMDKPLPGRFIARDWTNPPHPSYFAIQVVHR